MRAARPGRDPWLESQGFRLLRCWNNEVLKDTDDVVEAIWIALEWIRQHGVGGTAGIRSPSPRPSPARGEGDPLGLSPNRPPRQGGLAAAGSRPRSHLSHQSLFVSLVS